MPSRQPSRKKTAGRSRVSGSTRRSQCRRVTAAAMEGFSRRGDGPFRHYGVDRPAAQHDRRREAGVDLGRDRDGQLFFGPRRACIPSSGADFCPTRMRKPDEKPVCVLNYNFWQRRFHGDPEIAGKVDQARRARVHHRRRAHPGSSGAVLFNFVPDVWVPVAIQKSIAPNFDDINARGERWMSCARAALKPGVTPQQAEAALERSGRHAAGQGSIRKPTPACSFTCWPPGRAGAAVAVRYPESFR